MSPLYLKDGKLLIQDGKLAGNQQCCCGGSCCMTGCVEMGIAIFMYSDTGQVVTNINEAPEIPGYLKIDPTVAIFSYTKVVPCPVPEEGSQEYIDAKQAFYDAIIASLPNNIEIYNELFPEQGGYWNFNYGTGEECSDTILDPKCTEIGGIWKPNQTCSADPCGGECGCTLREGSTIEVEVAGHTFNVDVYECSGLCGTSSNICESGNTYDQESYCETQFGSFAEATVRVGCHDLPEWDSVFVGFEKPANWPTSGVVVCVDQFWHTHTIYNECFGPYYSANRYIFYRLACDGEGYPADAVLFHDTGVININDEEENEYVCFDCTTQPTTNHACDALPTPSSVTVVENPLP